ncbi:MAG: DUF4215 domain-containing protein [Myxococcota bacterium]|nr:DUF4215 domain-containing protein [Myxococcota bacterium]
MNGSFSLIRTTIVFGVMWSAFGCGEEATETARQCAQSNLIEQCPIGSTPELNASATSRCAGQANGSILEENGQVVGGCQAVGECTVFCRFSNPCGALGIARFDKDYLVCNEYQGSCPDDVCEPGIEDREGPYQCPVDCNDDCSPGQTGCLRTATGEPAQWDCIDGNYRTSICPPGQRCEVVSTPTDEIEFFGRCVDESTGTGGGAGASGAGGTGGASAAGGTGGTGGIGGTGGVAGTGGSGGTEPLCGNRVIEGDELCDDGNDVEDDGCTSNCQECLPDSTQCASPRLGGVLTCVDGAWQRQACMPSTRCLDGECRPIPVCTDGEFRCLERTIGGREICTDGQWERSERECGAGEICVDGDCVVAMQECRNEDTRCVEGLLGGREVCVDGRWESSPCNRNEECIGDGECVANQVMRCVNGRTRCQDVEGRLVRQLCQTSQWRDDPCGIGEICQGEGECVPNVRFCQDGRRECTADNPNAWRECVDGRWGEPVSCNRNEMCSDGQCVAVVRACESGATRCSGDNVQRCDDEGNWVLASECGELGCGTPVLRGAEAQCRCRIGAAECSPARGAQEARNCTGGFWRVTRCNVGQECALVARGRAECR